MKKTLLSVFHLWLKWAETGRARGIEHFAVALFTGLFSFLNMNTIQALGGARPFLLYEDSKLYFTAWVIVVIVFFKILLPKSYLLNQNFTAIELKKAKMILLAYLIGTLVTLVLGIIYYRQTTS